MDKRSPLPLLLFFIALSATAFVAAFADDRILFRISIENPSRHFETWAVRHFAETLSRRAAGELLVEFYDGARLFRDADVAAALERGRVEMAVPGIWNLDRFAPDCAAIMLPRAYGRSAELMRGLADGPLGAAIDAALERDLAVHIVGGWLDLGHAHLFGVNRRLRSMADIAGLKVRVAGGRANEERVRALGGRPVSIPAADITAYLDRRLVDAVLTTYETVDSLGIAGHGLVSVYEDAEYYPFFVPIIGDPVWKRLSPRLRALIEETWKDQLAASREEAARAQESAKARLAEGGMAIVVASPEERAATRASLELREDEMARRLGISEEVLEIYKRSLEP
ncbi:MAG TPA: TRAP transporter substrate-binding protein DctP [Rectinemataceae bacterium]|nr:TRAP transporter substrate-binding protein DctP [Rectinemataceae bacterium]